MGNYWFQVRLHSFFKNSYLKTLSQLEDRSLRARVRYIRSLLKGLAYLLLFVIIVLCFMFFNTTKSYHSNKYIVTKEKNQIIEMEKHFYGWLSFHDISQAMYKIDKIVFVDLDCQKVFYNKPFCLVDGLVPSDSVYFDCITFAFKDITDFSLISIVPDERSLTSIKYTDRIKIDKIKREGLSFYAKFPEQQNKQTTRVLILTAFTTLFLDSAVRFFKNAYEKSGFSDEVAINFLSSWTSVKDIALMVFKAFGKKK